MNTCLLLALFLNMNIKRFLHNFTQSDKENLLHFLDHRRNTYQNFSVQNKNKKDKCKKIKMNGF